MAFIYTLASSLDGLVFYVGKATLDERIQEHIRAARSNRPKISRVAMRIRSIWQKGGKVIVRKPYKRISDMIVYQLEKQVIESYGYEQLVNLPPSQLGRDRGIYPNRCTHARRRWQEDHAMDEAYGEE
jgi:hypothetical protein